MKKRAVGPQWPALDSNRTTERTESYESVDRSCNPGNRRLHRPHGHLLQAVNLRYGRMELTTARLAECKGRRIVEFSETVRVSVE